MRLLVNGLSFPVDQMGPDFVPVDIPVNHGRTAAVVVLEVDQNGRRWNVRLPNGFMQQNLTGTIGRQRFHCQHFTRGIVGERPEDQLGIFMRDFSEVTIWR